MENANKQLKIITEGLIFASEEPLNIEQLLKVLKELDPALTSENVKSILDELCLDYQEKSIELKEVGSGYRFQIRTEYAPWINKLWEKRPPRYSKALLEILAIIAYRQPITRAEIEDIRGVSIHSNIMRTLSDREWISIIGYKDVPGRPALYATTDKFLDYFNLKSLEELPILQEKEK